VLHYQSNNPTSHKRSYVRTIFKQAQTHCSNLEHQKKETDHLDNIFQQHGYPQNFIKKCLTTQATAEPTQAMKRLTLPYIKNISQPTNRLLQPHSITIAHKTTKALQNILSKSKDPVAQEETRSHLQRAM